MLSLQPGLYLKMLSLLNKQGYAEIQPGLYLWDKDSLIEEQKSWVDSDECKNFDFSDHEYWITCEDGGDPKGADSIDEDLLEIIGIEACRKFLG